MHRKTHHKNEKTKLTDQIIFTANETNKNTQITTKENKHRNLLNVPMVFREIIL
jgi:hypothetical protein